MSITSANAGAVGPRLSTGPPRPKRAASSSSLLGLILDEVQVSPPSPTNSNTGSLVPLVEVPPELGGGHGGARCARRSCLCQAPLPYDVHTKSPLPPRTPRSRGGPRRCRGRLPYLQCVYKKAEKTRPTTAPDFAKGGSTDQLVPRLSLVEAPSTPQFLAALRRSSSGLRATDDRHWSRTNSPLVSNGGQATHHAALFRSLSQNSQASRNSGRNSKSPVPEACNPTLGADVLGIKAIAKSRLHRLRLRRAAEHRRNERKLRCAQQFSELPFDEQEALRWAFERAITATKAASNEEDEAAEQEEEGAAKAMLDAKGVATACWELGLGGASFEERSEVKRISEETAEWYDLHEFATDVVPRVRIRFGEMGGRDLLRLFSHYDQGDGTISPRDCCKIGQSVGVDGDMVEWYLEGESVVTLEMCHTVVSRCREKLQFCLRQYEVGIKEKTGMSEDLFQHFRSDLITLRSLYYEHEIGEGGDTTTTPTNVEVTFMLKDFGFFSKDLMERRLVESLLNETCARLREEKKISEMDDCPFTFLEFLDLITEVRNVLQEFRQPECQTLFNLYDKDHSGALSIAEISALLSHLGVAPQTRAEQEELAELIMLADDDSSGSILFDEFETLCQRIDEKLNRLRFDEELDLGMNLGFTPPQVRDFRFLFAELDDDNSGHLDLDEVHAGLKILGKPISQPNLTKMFQRMRDESEEYTKVGVCSGASELDFSDFLKLMQTLRDHAGLFSEDAAARQDISTPKALDTRTMRRALMGLKLPKLYLATLTRDDMISRICKHLRCRPGTLFYQSLKIDSVAALLQRFRVD